MSKTRRNGRLVTEISGERNHADSRVGLGDFGEKRRALILAAIVDIDDLEIEISCAWPNTSAIRVWVSRITSSSLKRGTTTDRSDLLPLADGRGAYSCARRPPLPVRPSVKTRFGRKEKYASTQAQIYRLASDRSLMRLSRFVLTLFYLAGPLLIISELFTPALSIPILLLFAAYIVLLVSSSARPSLRCEVGSAKQLVAGLPHSRSASPGFITLASGVSPYAAGIT